VKVSITTTLHRSRGGQFALHAMALPGNPYDGHTLATVIPDMEKTIGNGITRILAILAAAGYNFRLLLNWLRLLLCLIFSAILPRS
jgi:IS5 family transposase